MNTGQWISILSDGDDFEDTSSLPLPGSLRKRKSPGGLEYIATANATSAAEDADGITPSQPSNNKHTLVCVPGWACQAADFIPLFQSLRTNNPDIHAYALNLPGHGSTSVALASKDASVSSSASLVQRFIDDLELTRVVLVGHGMGVRIAVQTWLQSQQQEPQQSNTSPFSRQVQEQQQKQSTIDALVFLDGDHSGIRPIAPCLLDDVPENKTVPGFQKLEFATSLFESLYGESTSGNFKATTAAHIRGMDADHVVRERAKLLEHDRKDFDAALQRLGRDERIGSSVLNLQATDYAENGKMFNLKEGDVALWMRHLRRRVPAARFGIVEDASHFLHTDRPEVVREKIVAFLRTR